MSEHYEVILFKELDDVEQSRNLSDGLRIHVTGVLTEFPVYKRYGILSLHGKELLADFTEVDLSFKFITGYLYHALGELRMVSDDFDFPVELKSTSKQFIKVRFMRSAIGMDLTLYEKSTLARRKFLEERKEKCSGK